MYLKDMITTWQNSIIVLYIGKDITAELLANNVVESTKCFLQEPQVLFQYNSSHRAPVSNRKDLHVQFAVVYICFAGVKHIKLKLQWI